MAAVAASFRAGAAGRVRDVCDGARNRSHNAPDHLILPIDRDQSAAESYAVAIWVFVTVAAYFAAILPMPLPLAIIVSHSSCIDRPSPPDRRRRTDSPARPRRQRSRQDRLRRNDVLLIVLRRSTSRAAIRGRDIVSWFFFAVLTCNAIAAVILWLLRGVVQAEESRCAR